MAVPTEKDKACASTNIGNNRKIPDKARARAKDLSIDPRKDCNEYDLTGHRSASRSCVSDRQTRRGSIGINLPSRFLDIISRSHSRMK